MPWPANAGDWATRVLVAKDRGYRARNGRSTRLNWIKSLGRELGYHLRVKGLSQHSKE